MRIDERSDEVAASLAGFYGSWAAYIGLELGFFDRLHEAGEGGLSVAQLATTGDCVAESVAAWVRAAHAGDLIELHDDRVVLDPDLATVLLDDTAPQFLGGHVASAVVSTLDYDRLLDFFRTGQPLAERPPRFHRAIERVTAQDITVFFQEGLAALPELTRQLSHGARVLDVACGGGRWLTAVARRFPETRLVGVEFEPDSVARAMRHVGELGLSDRVQIESRDIAGLAFDREFDLVYLQDALHELPDPVAGLERAWAAVADGGRLVVLEWCLPDDPEEDRSFEGQLLWGIQIDELFQGTRMYTLEGFNQLYARADVPAPGVAELPSGATLFVTKRVADAATG
jgi:SAM-dependent methyltransferase